MKASAEQALTIGWQAERFARTKNIRDPNYWLKPTKTKTPESGASDVRRMLDRMIYKQGNDNGAR